MLYKDLELEDRNKIIEEEQKKFEEEFIKDYTKNSPTLLPTITNEELRNILMKKLGYYVPFSMDGYLKKNLDVIRTAMALNIDWDYHFITCGTERVGKSCFASQVCFYIDPTFDLDRVVFSAEEFIEVAKKLEPHQAIMWDEAIVGGSKEDSSTKLGRTLKKFVAQMGKKNLFVMMNIPDFFDLNKNLSVHRTRGLFKVYAKDIFQKGYWGYYDIERKKNLWLLGRKTQNYDVQKYNVHGFFKNYWVFDEQEYLKKKAKALEEVKEMTKAEIYKKRLINMVLQLRRRGLTIHEIGEMVKLTDTAVLDLEREAETQEFKV